jgi:hypothetical protein
LDHLSQPDMPTARWSTVWRVVLIAGFVLYVLGISIVALKFRERNLPTGSIFELQAMYGPLVKNLFTLNLYASPDMLLTGHRMPFIPYFLTAIAKVRNDVFLAYAVKNLIFFSLTLAVLLFWKRHAPGGNDRPGLLTMVALASFPQFIFWATSPDIDEGYLIHLIAALSVGLFLFEKIVRARKWLIISSLGLLNAFLYLTKSSMLLLSIVICLLYWLKSSDLKVFGVFVGFILGAVTLWGWMNLQHSGTFAIGTSLDGWNLYKGNNEAALLLYPKYNLDIADDEGLTAFKRPAGMNEWEFNRVARGKAIEYALEHPLDELRLMGRRFIVFFLEIRRNPLYRGETQFESPVYWLGTLYMLVFRLVFLGSLWMGARRLWSYLHKPRSRGMEYILSTLCYAGILIAFALPYLVGFTSERHLMPLVIPTVIYWFSLRYDEGGIT